MNGAVTIRYVGNEDFARRFLLHRRDGRFYTGRGWSSRLDDARLYDTLAAAQRVYRKLMDRKHRAEPKRVFSIRLDLTVSGADPYGLDDVRDYLARAMQITFDNAAAGDGPNGSCVLARAILGTLVEVGGSPARRAD